MSWILIFLRISLEFKGFFENQAKILEFMGFWNISF